jgi:hypothetical protein
MFCVHMYTKVMSIMFYLCNVPVVFGGNGCIEWMHPLEEKIVQMSLRTFKCETSGTFWTQNLFKLLSYIYVNVS